MKIFIEIHCYIVSRKSEISSIWNHVISENKKFLYLFYIKVEKIVGRELKNNSAEEDRG